MAWIWTVSGFKTTYLCQDLTLVSLCNNIHLLSIGEGKGESDNVLNNEDEEMKAAFEKLKSRTYALTVPLRIIALRNSVPPLWIKVSAFTCFVKDSRVNCTIGPWSLHPPYGIGHCTKKALNLHFTLLKFDAVSPSNHFSSLN